MKPPQQPDCPALSPCPFCGLTDQDTISPDMGQTPAVSLCGYPRGYRVECEACGCNGPFRDTHPEALQAWNRRKGSMDAVLAGNALFFLRDLGPLYDFVNDAQAPRKVKECLKTINLAAASIRHAFTDDGYARAKAREEKITADLQDFIARWPLE